MPEDQLKKGLLTGLVVFLVLMLVNYLLVPDELLKAYVEKAVLIMSDILNGYFGEQTRVVGDTASGLRAVLKEGIGRETHVVYSYSHLNYPVLFLYIAAIYIWPASISRKVITTLFTIPLFLATEFALMFSAYFIEIYYPLMNNFYTHWAYPVIPAMLCMLVFYVFIIRPSKSTLAENG